MCVAWMVPLLGMIARMPDDVANLLVHGAPEVMKLPLAPVSAMKGVGGGLERDEVVLEGVTGRFIALMKLLGCSCCCLVCPTFHMPTLALPNS